MNNHIDKWPDNTPENYLKKADISFKKQVLSDKIAALSFVLKDGRDAVKHRKQNMSNSTPTIQEYLTVAGANLSRVMFKSKHNAYDQYRALYSTFVSSRPWLQDANPNREHIKAAKGILMLLKENFQYFADIKRTKEHNFPIFDLEDINKYLQFIENERPENSNAQN